MKKSQGDLVLISDADMGGTITYCIPGGWKYELMGNRLYKGWKMVDLTTLDGNVRCENGTGVGRGGGVAEEKEVTESLAATGFFIGRSSGVGVPRDLRFLGACDFTGDVLPIVDAGGDGRDDEEGRGGDVGESGDG